MQLLFFVAFGSYDPEGSYQAYDFILMSFQLWEFWDWLFLQHKIPLKADNISVEVKIFCFLAKLVNFISSLEVYLNQKDYILDALCACAYGREKNRFIDDY